MATASDERVVQLSKKKFIGGIIVLILIALVGMGVQSASSAASLIYDFRQLMDAITGIIVILSVLLLIWGLATYIIDGPVNDPERNKKIGRKRMVLGVIIFLVVGLLWVLAQFLNNSMGIQGSSANLRNQEMPYIDNSVSDSSYSAPSIPMMTPPYYQDQKQQADITDTREFLKTSYSADIKTRDVRAMARNVKSIIREVDGRVDNEQIDEKRASLRFVVPQTKFESFRSEVEDLGYAKLYTENVSSENLLGQKQDIEQQTSSQSQYLADLQQQKQTLDNAHMGTAASYKKELASVVAQLATVRANLATAETTEKFTLYQIQETTLMDRESSLRRKIDIENKTYATKSTDLTNQIANAEAGLSSLSQQDTQLMNNVATVSGSISIERASLWAIAVLVSPLHPAWIILILLLLLWWFGRRVGFLPRVEFV